MTSTWGEKQVSKPSYGEQVYLENRAVLQGRLGTASIASWVTIGKGGKPFKEKTPQPRVPKGSERRTPATSRAPNNLGQNGIGKTLDERKAGRLELVKPERRKKSRPPRRRPRRKARRDAIVIKPAEGKSFADVVGLIRKSVKPEESGTEVRKVRMTRDGGVLLEIDRCRDAAALKQSISAAVGVSGEVRTLSRRVKLEVLDLDICVDENEVREAIKSAAGESSMGTIGIVMFPPSARGDRMAIVDIDESAGMKILNQIRVKIGWIRCRVRRRVEVTRCHRCLGYGHTRRECQGPDRSEDCWRCGEKGHSAKGCTAPPICRVCEENGKPKDHIQGSGSCRTFRDILSRMKDQHRRD